MSTPIYDHSFNEFVSLCKKSDFLSFSYRDIVDLKILQSDWSEAFWLISQAPEFFQIWDLSKHTVININFHYRPNGEKIKELRKKLNFPINLKNPRLGLFSHFWGKTLFSRNLPLSCTTPQGPLTPCWVPEKTKEPIPRKLQNRRTDRPYWNEPSGHGQGSNRRISQLRATAVDNKNKIKYSSS